MIKPAHPTVTISLASYTPGSFGEEFAETFRKAGVEAHVVRRKREVAAALEWIVPTAIMVLIGQKFFGTILQEAGKDLYAELKRRVGVLVQRACGRERVFDPKMVAAGGETFDPYANVSVVVETLTGKRVVFPFRLNLESRDYDESVAELFRLAEGHFVVGHEDELVELLKTVEHEPGHTVFMRFDAVDRAWRPIDTMVEARKAFERQQAERHDKR